MSDSSSIMLFVAFVAGLLIAMSLIPKATPGPSMRDRCESAHGVFVRGGKHGDDVCLRRDVVLEVEP